MQACFGGPVQLQVADVGQLKALQPDCSPHKDGHAAALLDMAASTRQAASPSHPPHLEGDDGPSHDHRILLHDSALAQQGAVDLGVVPDRDIVVEVAAADLGVLAYAAVAAQHALHHLQQQQGFGGRGLGLGSGLRLPTPTTSRACRRLQADEAQTPG